MRKQREITWFIDEDGCWICDNHCRNTDGYPIKKVNGHFKNISHIMYKRVHGENSIPNGMFLLHSCDNPNCINPDHLSIGTHAENMQQMVDRGRQKNQTGSLNEMAKLKESDVIEIKKLLKDGTLFHREIAEKYNVSRGTITDINNNRKWSHIIIDN